MSRLYQALIILLLLVSISHPGEAQETTPLPPGTYTITTTADELPGPAAFLAGNVSMTFDGYRYFVVLNGGVVVEGRYTLSGDQLTVTDELGFLACLNEGSGTYQWTLEGDVLTLKAVQDVCLGRLLIVTLKPFTRADVQLNPADFAPVHVAHLIADAPALIAVVNGTPRPFSVGPLVISDYLNYVPGTYSFAYLPEDGDTPILGPVDLTFEPGNRYIVLLTGQMSDNSVNLTLVNETDALDSIDLTTSTAGLLIHNIIGAPAVDFLDGETLLVTNLEAGQSIFSPFPPGPGRPVTVTAAGDPTTTLFEVDIPETTPGLYGVVGLYGNSPENYSYAAGAVFVGELNLTEGAAITLGQPIEGEITQPGERVRHTLTLEADMSVNVILSSAPDSGFDAYLSIWDASGVLLSATDEISYEDEGLDAGTTGLHLPAGSYTFEVGTFYDRTAGTYNLLVEAAE